MKFMKTRQSVKILKYLISSLGLVVFLMVAPAALAQEEHGFVVDKIIAKVDNYIVLKSELEGTYQNYITEGHAPSEIEKCNFLNRLVVNKLLVAKAEIDSVIVTDAEVDNNTDQRMNMLLQGVGNSPESLEQRYGKTFAEMKIELRDQIREQLLGREMTEKITKAISITPAEVKRFLNKIPKDSLPLYSSDVEVAQIVKIAKVSDSQKELARKKLLDLREQIQKQGANFNELAIKYSDDPTAAKNGGELGYVGRGAMVPEFEAVAFKMSEGEISQPFESPYGMHILQLSDRRGNEYNSRHILISFKPSDKDLKRVSHYLDSLRRKIVKDSIKFEAAAKLYSDDKASKDHGGFFSDADGGTRMSLRDMDYIIYLAIDSMDVGEVSKPLPYRTDDGKEAVRILYFKTKISPHVANLKDDWFRIQAGALSEKKDKALDKWFHKARTDVFISIDPLYGGCKILE
jgi:peptidyl-prolyl cis-trans isomerase SurA